eukprot:g40769.t1
MKPDGPLGIDRGIGKDNCRKKPCQPCKMLLTNIWELVLKLGEMSNSPVQQQPDIVTQIKLHVTDNVPNVTITITIPGNVQSSWQVRPRRDDYTVVCSQEEVALGVLNIDPGPHEARWLQVKHRKENLLLTA